VADQVARQVLHHRIDTRGLTPNLVHAVVMR
jgi:hypothetical protein